MSKCTECNEYDKEKFYCPKWCEVIKGTIEDARTDERAKTVDEFVEYVKQYMWWSTQADEKVIGEFALEEYANVFKNKLKVQNNE